MRLDERSESNHVLYQARTLRTRKATTTLRALVIAESVPSLSRRSPLAGRRYVCPRAIAGEGPHLPVRDGACAPMA
jgi:hypothetical protein